jgi:hypothetical protein
MAFHLHEGTTVLVSEPAQGPPGPSDVTIYYDNKSWKQAVSAEATTEDIRSIARRQWRIPAERQLTVRERTGRSAVHLGEEYILEEERPQFPVGTMDVAVIHNAIRAACAR